jgi:hypothetical protein
MISLSAHHTIYSIYLHLIVLQVLPVSWSGQRHLLSEREKRCDWVALAHEGTHSAFTVLNMTCNLSAVLRRVSQHDLYSLLVTSSNAIPPHNVITLG